MGKVHFYSLAQNAVWHLCQDALRCVWRGIESWSTSGISRMTPRKTKKALLSQCFQTVDKRDVVLTNTCRYGIIDTVKAGVLYVQKKG